MADEINDLDDTEDSPWIVALCPVTPELAGQIVDLADRDWGDRDRTEEVLGPVGWRSTGDYLGDLGEKCYSPVGHLVYGDDCFDALRVSVLDPSRRRLDRGALAAPARLAQPHRSAGRVLPGLGGRGGRDVHRAARRPGPRYHARTAPRTRLRPDPVTAGGRPVPARHRTAGLLLVAA